MPGLPLNLRLVEASSDSLTLQWDFAPEAASYRLYLDGQEVASGHTSPNYYRFTGLTTQTSYRLGVQAVSAAGAGEIWLVTQCLGQPVSLGDAFILESLSSGVRAVAFMVPAALGIQEGGLILFGALFGLPAEIGLAISLSKRVRELLLGLPGLFVWYWVERHYLLRAGEE